MWNRGSALGCALIVAASPLTATTPGPHGRSAADYYDYLAQALHLPQRHGAAADTALAQTISIGSHEASVRIDLAGNRARTVALRNGVVLVDGSRVGTYAPGGVLDRSWREELSHISQLALDARSTLAALQHWPPAPIGASGEESVPLAAMQAALLNLASAPQAAEAAAESVASEADSVASGVAAVTAPIVAPVAAPIAAARAGAWDRLFADVRNVIGVFIALAMTGFGLVFFGRRYLEVVSDTARHSFGRAFVTGVLGQLLLLPTLAMLIVGLVFTIVGILLLPFALVAFILAACGAVLGGYLAVAHAVGETFTRRRMANGAVVRAPNAYGYLFTGLIGLLGLWAAAALFGWAGPVVILFRLAAAVVTWVATTAGFGAVLLSRAGLRETFSGRVYGEMSDEYLWATPPATPTSGRMGQRP